MYNEEQIIKGCKRNKKHAQKELFEKYAPGMRGICKRYAHNSDEAKDILQEGFIKIFKEIKKYSGKGSFEGWLKKVMVNTAINHYHKNKKFYRQYDPDNENIDASIAEEDNYEQENEEIDKKDINEDVIDIGLILKARFSAEELLETIKILPDEYRMVFNLYFIENYRHKEIAGLLNIAENTSRIRLLRARSMIRKELYTKTIEKLGK